MWAVCVPSCTICLNSSRLIQVRRDGVGYQTYGFEKELGQQSRWGGCVKGNTLLTPLANCPVLPLSQNSKCAQGVWRSLFMANSLLVYLAGLVVTHCAEQAAGQVDRGGRRHARPSHRHIADGKGQCGGDIEPAHRHACPRSQ